MLNISEHHLTRGIAYISTVIAITITGAALLQNSDHMSPEPFKPEVHLQEAQTTHPRSPSLFKEAFHPSQRLLEPLKSKEQQISAALPPPEQPSQHKYQVRLGQGSWYVQVGAFQKEGLAYRLAQSMKTQYKQVKVIKKKAVLAVWVGPLLTQGSAKHLQAYILRHNHIKGFTIKE